MSIKAYGTVTVVNVNDGAKGDTGVGVASVTPMYYLSTSYETPQGGQWVTTKPEIPVPTTQNPTQYYLWTKQVTTLSNGDTVSSAEVCDYTITGIDRRVSEAENKISTKVWEQDIASYVADYDSGQSPTYHSIRDRISSTQQSVNSISSTIGDWTTLSQDGSVTIANKVSSIEQTADKIYMLVEADDGSSSQSSSFELTDAAITAITNKFIIKAPGNNPNDATIISGGRIHANAITTAMLATDAIKSTNYTKSSSNTSAYSNTGSFFNLSTGSIETPNFGVDNTNGRAYLNGEIIATSGQIGDSSSNYWEIGTKTDYNAATSAAIIAHGSSYIQSGQFMIHDDKINTQSYDSQRKITYPKYNNVYYDFGMQAPQLNIEPSDPMTGISDLFLYARKHNNNIPTMESEWDYVFKVDKDGTIYENGVKLSEKYASINGVSGAYLPRSGGTITGSLTINNDLTVEDDLTVNSDLTLIGDLLDNLGVSYFSRFVKTTDVIDVAHGGTGQTTLASGQVLIGSGTNGIATRAIKNNTSVGTLGWFSGTASNGTYIVTLNTLKNWDGRYNDTVSPSSNLQYWQGGQFGTMANESADDYLKLSGGTVTGNLTVDGTITGNVSGSATSLTTSAGSATQPVYFSNGIPKATTYSLNKTVPSDAVFTDTNWYHTSGSWSGFKYTATKSNSSMGALEFTIPTGTTSSTVAIGNHTHGNYASKITLAGTEYSVSSSNEPNNIDITQNDLQSAVQDDSLVLMTSAERTKLDSIQVSQGGSIGFSDVTASSPLSATVDAEYGTVNITHNTISNDFGGTYRSVTVNKYGHVTAGNNPTTLSGYGIIDAKIENGIITLGGNTITPLTASSTLDATKLSGTASINTTGNAGALTNKTLNSTTINNTAGSFTFEGSGDPWASTDWVGLQVGSNTDKFQLHASNSTTLEYRQNDNGGTNTIWSSWYSLLSSGNYTDYTVTKTGSGASGTWGIGISGNAATATKATQDSDGNAINSTYLKLSGGTMTASAIINLTPPSSAATWKTGRDKAKIKMSTYGGYVPIASIKTTDGSWDIAPYSENIINFTYVKDTTYSGSSNVYDARIKFTSTGGIDAMGTIAVGSHAVLTYNSTYNCLEFSFV